MSYLFFFYSIQSVYIYSTPVKFLEIALPFINLTVISFIQTFYDFSSSPVFNYSHSVSFTHKNTTLPLILYSDCSYFSKRIIKFINFMQKHTCWLSVCYVQSKIYNFNSDIQDYLPVNFTLTLFHLFLYLYALKLYSL